MSLVQDDIDNIEALVRKLVTDMTRRARSFHDYDEIELRERAIRVEEELKHQRELMMEGFKQMEKRFEQVDKRFEQMQLETNKRFEQMQFEMNKRFEQVDKRLEQVDKRFEQVDKRFEQIQLETNKRFEQMQLEMNKRFELVDKRFEQLTARIDRFMLWSFTTTVSVGGLVVAFIKLT